MKRILSLILICSVLLCGCGEGQPGSVPQPSSVVENCSSAPQSSLIVDSDSPAETSSVTSDNSQYTEYVFKDVFLEPEADKSEDYNSAIKAFNNFLESKKEENKLPYGKLYYAIIDLTKDGIPELLIEKTGYATAYTSGYIFTENDIKELDMPMQRPQGGSFRILSDCKIASRIVNTETCWTFNSYDSEGNCYSFQFVENNGSYGDEFIFNGEKIEKEEFYILAQPYMERYDKTAEIEWTSYYKE